MFSVLNIYSTVLLSCIDLLLSQYNVRQCNVKCGIREKYLILVVLHVLESADFAIHNLSKKTDPLSYNQRWPIKKCRQNTESYQRNVIETQNKNTKTARNQSEFRHIPPFSNLYNKYFFQNCKIETIDTYFMICFFDTYYMDSFI